MFDTLTRDPELRVWLDQAEYGDAELALAIAEADPGIPREPSIPPDLAAMEPGIVLSGLLWAIDVNSLSGHDRVIVMAAHQRMASHHQANLYAAMASVAEAVSEELLDRDGETDFEIVEQACSSEIRAALRLTRRAADNELSIARDFQTRLPAVWQEFAAGRIDRRRANLILHRTDHLPVTQAQEVARRALERASELTTGQLTELLRKLSVEADPADAKHRYENAVDERRVVLEPGTDGTAHLFFMDLPPDRAARIRDRIDSAARDLRTSGETRTMDQLRADVALDLLDPSVPHSGRESGRGSLVMTVDMATLAGLTESSGDLGGYGPVISDVARRVAETSLSDEWRFVVTDAEHQPICSGITRRRPTAADRRAIETAFPTCTFPGCRVPSTRCDLDHMTPWSDGGPTCWCNLAPLCRHDHRVRHGAGWSYRRTEAGSHEWTSPLSHRYSSEARAP
ncbi:MAG TPA: DUF222 domain-containing protein [Acidimicrobiia bacterium]|nr:DUF222 domain-containing protein [Acidimicrobiia bacterium]